MKTKTIRVFGKEYDRKYVNLIGAVVIMAIIVLALVGITGTF